MPTIEEMLAMLMGNQPQQLPGLSSILPNMGAPPSPLEQIMSLIPQQSTMPTLSSLLSPPVQVTQQDILGAGPPLPPIDYVGKAKDDLEELRRLFNPDAAYDEPLQLVRDQIGQLKKPSKLGTILNSIGAIATGFGGNPGAAQQMLASNQRQQEIYQGRRENLQAQEQQILQSRAAARGRATEQERGFLMDAQTRASVQLGEDRARAQSLSTNIYVGKYQKYLEDQAQSRRTEDQIEILNTQARLGKEGQALKYKFDLMDGGLNSDEAANISNKLHNGTRLTPLEEGKHRAAIDNLRLHQLELSGRERKPLMLTPDMQANLDDPLIKDKPFNRPLAAVISKAGKATTGDNITDTMIRTISTKYGIDPDEIFAMVAQESGGKMSALSGKGARGIMQVDPRNLPGLSKIAGRQLDLGNRYDNILAGILVYKGDRIDRGFTFLQAVGAYHTGPDDVNKVGGDVTKLVGKNNWDGTIFTADHVAKVASNYKTIKQLTQATGEGLDPKQLGQIEKEAADEFMKAYTKAKGDKERPLTYKQLDRTTGQVVGDIDPPTPADAGGLVPDPMNPGKPKMVMIAPGELESYAFQQGTMARNLFLLNRRVPGGMLGTPADTLKDTAIKQPDKVDDQTKKAVDEQVEQVKNKVALTRLQNPNMSDVEVRELLISEADKAKLSPAQREEAAKNFIPPSSLPSFVGGKIKSFLDFITTDSQKKGTSPGKYSRGFYQQ